MAVRSGSKVRADIKSNRLYITLSVTASKKELEKVYTDVRFCVADLKPGFDVITDLSQCTLGHLSGIPIFRKIMDYLVQHRPGEVIRVVGKMSVLFKQLIMLATRFQVYKPVYVTTIEEAEERLASSRRNALRFHLHRQKVAYSVGGKSGTGQLVDASVLGCAVGGSTLPVAVADAVTLTFSLRQSRDDWATFTLAATVTRVDEELFAVQFNDIGEEQTARLYACLAHEARCDSLP
ncbi:MAG: PilZ domain-containing protein [Desulfobulbaceae bacterium]|nr:MAG: PilZ domain-containing protein [Desulfobulbaceae bacterium]